MKVALRCSCCNEPFEREKGEINRQRKRGRTEFFCSLTCGANYTNAKRDDLRVEVTKVCPVCKNKFQTMTGSKSATFCSRSCASSGSVTENRLEEQSKAGHAHRDNLLQAHETLRIREYWKYEKLKSFLSFVKESFEFEYPMGSYVYDLALIKRKLIIEFDGVYHGGTKQKEIDERKDVYAHSEGWKICRVAVKPNTLIDPQQIYELLT